MIVDLLGNKSFQHYWTDLVLNMVKCDSSNILLPGTSQQQNSTINIFENKIVKKNCCKESQCAISRKTILESLDELVRTINLSVETFMYSCKLFKLFLITFIIFCYSSLSNE